MASGTESSAEIHEALQRSIGDRYRVEQELGAGGMAVVFGAHDLRHDRRVAIKVLRPELAAAVGGERFLKEIQVTAQLTHPHILGLIDSGTAGALPFYVMPYVTGETLRQRMERERQLPVHEATRIATAIAQALDFAHRHGVVHRDIKPENVLLQDGQPIVADFGIALAVVQSAGRRLTDTGMAMGTPAYMSPEQFTAEHPVDARADIYALGCMTYEMLAGTPPFHGNTAQAILTAVMTTDPIPVDSLRRTVPLHLSAAVTVALQKVPQDRFDTASEFVAALEGPTARTLPFLRSAQQGVVAARRRLLAVGVVTLVAGLALGYVATRSSMRAEARAPTMHVSMMLPASAPLALTGPGPLGIWQSSVALSPTGDLLVYVTPQGASTALALRPMHRDSVSVLAGTEGAYHPFFSPDGKWIAFFSGNELRKVQVGGGNSVVLTTVERPVGATWPTMDQILLFQHDGFQMRRIEAAGGSDSTITLHTQFATPHVLPDGKWAIGHLGPGELGMVSLEDGSEWVITRRGVLPVDSVTLSDVFFAVSPVYIASTQHVVYGTGDGDLMALPFDGKSRRVLGDPVPVVSGVRIEEGVGFGEFAVAANGTLVYVPGRSQLFGQPAYVGPNGRLDTLALPRGQYTQPRMSPDGQRFAVQEQKAVGGWDVVLLDIPTGVRQRIPIDGNYRVFPAAWFPDGKRLLLGYWDPIRYQIREMRIYDLASGALEDLGQVQGAYLTIHPNGRDMAASDWRTADLFVRSLRDTTRTRIPARGHGSEFSPNGRWLAFGSVDGSVQVSPIPPTGGTQPIVERGQQVMWRRDGRALIYRDGRRFYDVGVNPETGTRTSAPRMLAEGPFIRTFAWNYTLAPDGRVVALVSLPGGSTRQLGVVAGFDQELLRVAPKRTQR